jgi:serine carboxypeptidase-like clade 4
VDQPAGAGFSYGTTDTDEAGVSTDLWEFLQAFFQAHPTFSKNGFYVTGESYAGHYVPATSFKIFTNNQNLQPNEVAVNLVGFSIGNGLTDPQVQYQYYPELAYNWSTTKIGAYAYQY